MTSTAPRVDWRHLVHTLDVAKEYHGLSDRAAAECIGISPSAVCRLREGKGGLSADGLAALVAWLYPSSCPPWIVPGTSPAEPTEVTE